MAEQSSIQCPNCGTPIDVNDVLKHQLEDSIRKEFQQKATIQNKELELKNEQLEKAKTEFNKTSNREPRKIGQFYYEAAFIAFSEGKLAEAQENIEFIFKTLLPSYSSSKNKLPNQNSLYAETVLLDALDLQALIFLAENKPKEALKSYELSFQIEEMIQSLLVYENSKIITQVRNRNRTEKCIEIYLSLYEKERKMSYLESAFLLSEQTKSVVLKPAGIFQGSVAHHPVGIPIRPDPGTP